eukprot:CAMPEP_0170080584 /NCGR_PEP_ID=MMETSP0019_2-20121128/16694_1 /TAXON_ID=98059 /ORGANISM="Dinobryon sp., Strain UTEXLB2267" /LENGTH=88 /DNA_ID=CAMNT_0010294645 /DNA_START=314 /DNA_END=580 /DNA_ORIENTATION=+
MWRKFRGHAVYGANTAAIEGGGGRGRGRGTIAITPKTQSQQKRDADAMGRGGGMMPYGMMMPTPYGGGGGFPPRGNPSFNSSSGPYGR